MLSNTTLFIRKRTDMPSSRKGFCERWKQPSSACWSRSWNPEGLYLCSGGGDRHVGHEIIPSVHALPQTRAFQLSQHCWDKMKTELLHIKRRHANNFNFKNPTVQETSLSFFWGNNFRNKMVIGASSSFPFQVPTVKGYSQISLKPCQVLIPTSTNSRKAGTNKRVLFVFMLN